ncbi:MAG: winged helix-turn-helix domain-containing protein, partial [Kibdelosporangium sp.]
EPGGDGGMIVRERPLSSLLGSRENAGVAYGGMRAPVRFALLGPLRAWRAGVELELGPPQQRLLLAMLLTNAGRPVGLDELVDVLWEDRPPATAVNVVHRYVGALRRVFEPELPTRATGGWLTRQGATYQLAVGPE